MPTARCRRSTPRAVRPPAHPASQTDPYAIKAGPEDVRALTISSPAGFAEFIARAATPIHLATPETELNVELFMAVCAELGDVILGPPGTKPGDVASNGGA